MPKKTLPYLFLAFLLAVLLFIVGIRYGQYVEQTNRTSVTVTPSPSPTPIPTKIPLSFTEYTHTGCQISFLVPNELEKTSESSSSALFSTDAKKLAIALSCEKGTYVKNEKEIVSTVNTSIRAYEVSTSDTVSYRIYHSFSGKIVTVTVAKSYLPLITKSLALSK